MNLMSYVLNVIGQVDMKKIKIQISSEKKENDIYEDIKRNSGNDE